MPPRPRDVMFGQQEEQVRHHLGIMVEYSSGLELMTVERLSEPILALAAHIIIFHNLYHSVLVWALSALKQFLLLQGKSGEIFVMLPLAAARHRACLRHPASQSHLATGSSVSLPSFENFKWRPSVLLAPPMWDFIQSLIDPTLLPSDHAESLQDFSSGMEKLSVLQFNRPADSEPPSADVLYAAYMRGVADACYLWLLVPTSDCDLILAEVKARKDFGKADQDKARVKLHQAATRCFPRLRATANRVYWLSSSIYV